MPPMICANMLAVFGSTDYICRCIGSMCTFRQLLIPYPLRSISCIRPCPLSPGYLPLQLAHCIEVSNQLPKLGTPA